MNLRQNILLKNTLFNLVGRFASLIVGLILTPYLIVKLGPVQFGLWSITLAISGFVGIVDLGISPAIIKFIAEFWSKENRQEAADTLLTGVSIAFIMALVFIVLIWVFTLPIVKILKVPPNLEFISIDLVRSAIIILGITYLSNCLQSAIAGLQRMGLVNGINIASSVCGALASFAILTFGWSLRGLILSHYLAAITALILGTFGVVRLISLQHIIKSRVRLPLVRAMFGYGMKIQISSTCSLVIQLMNKLFVSSFAGLRQVATFEIGNRVTNYANSLPIAFFSALIPAWAESSVRLDIQEIKKMYHRYMNFFLFLSFPFIIFTICCARPMVLAWVGKGFDSSVWVVQILLIGYGINLQTGIGTTLLRGMGKPELEMIYGLITVGTNAFMSIYFAKKWGFIGLLFGVSIAQIIGSSFFFFRIRQFVGSHHLFPQITTLFITSALPGLLMIALNYFLLPISEIQFNRFTTLVLLIIEAIIFFVIYSLLSWKNPVFIEMKNFVKYSSIVKQHWPGN